MRVSKPRITAPRAKVGMPIDAYFPPTDFMSGIKMASLSSPYYIYPPQDTLHLLRWALVSVDHTNRHLLLSF